MAESPVSLKKVDCGNGKKKMIVREREYDLVSWHGLKTMTAVVVAIAGAVIAVLTAYYTAEASQNTTLAEYGQQLAKQEERTEITDKNLATTFQKIDATLIEQRKILDETKQTVTRIDTRQQVLIREVEKISDKLDKPTP